MCKAAPHLPGLDFQWVMGLTRVLSFPLDKPATAAQTGGMRSITDPLLAIVHLQTERTLSALDIPLALIAEAAPKSRIPAQIPSAGIPEPCSTVSAQAIMNAYSTGKFLLHSALR